MTRHRTPLIAILATTVAAFGLTACGRDDGRTAGQKLDAAVAKVEQKADAASQRIAEEAAKAKQEVGQAAAQAGDMASDVALTAAVNAELARDSELSALKIDVDTHDGKVALHGSAPNAAARERASQIASAVDGVKTVDNQLTVSAN